MVAGRLHDEIYRVDVFLAFPPAVYMRLRAVFPGISAKSHLKRGDGEVTNCIRFFAYFSARTHQTCK